MCHTFNVFLSHSGGIQVLNNLAELVHLELDVFGNVDESLEDDGFEVLQSFLGVSVPVGDLVPLFLFHAVRLGSLGLTLVLHNDDKLRAVRSAKLLADHAL